MEVAVFGLGYVGTVSTACLALAGHRVVGVDVNPLKVDLVNSGRTPVVEDEVGELLAEGVRTGSIRATSDGAAAVAETEVSLICVGTPSRENGSLDTAHLRGVMASIGEGLARRDDYHVVIVRSTSLPGTADEVRTLLEEKSGRRAGPDFGLCINPEFLREGSAVDDFYDPPFTVIGELDERSGEVAAALYADLDAEVHRVGLGVAEMVKYACNAFHAVKVSFANEIAAICKAQEIDGVRVMDLVARDKKLNISRAYLRPGFAFGGSCLPKDLRAVTYHANRLDLRTPLLSSVLPSNETHLDRGTRMILREEGRPVALLGLAFKGGTDDLRESPMVRIAETLIGKGRSLRIYDESVRLARLMGANKAFLEEKIPHISSLLTETLDEAVDFADVLVIGNNSPTIAHLPDVLQGRSPKTIVDLIGNYPEGSLGDHDHRTLV